MRQKTVDMTGPGNYTDGESTKRLCMPPSRQWCGSISVYPVRP